MFLLESLVESGGVIMNKDRRKIKNYASIIYVLLALILLSLIYYSYSQYVKEQGKSAPQVSQVKEKLDQARALQKQGKLAESVMIYEQYALQGYPNAMFYLAKSYSKGWGVKPDLDKARRLLLNAIEYNFRYRGESAYQLGRLFQKSAGPNCNTIAVEWFKKALKWHYIKASLSLATHYEQGLGVEQDLKKAIFYYQMATQEGISVAALKHARLIISGKFGLKKDVDYGTKLLTFAVTEFEKEALKGKASSAKTLGRLYRNGTLINLVKQNSDNVAMAIHWFRLASDLGDSGAMHDLGHLLLFISESSNHQEAITLFKKAAEIGHGGAATTLGRFHLQEKFNLKKQRAIPWLKKGVVVGHSGAIKELAIVYFEGKLIKRNLDKAIELLQVAANKGHSGSRKLLNKYLKKKKELNVS